MYRKALNYMKIQTLPYRVVVPCSFSQFYLSGEITAYMIGRYRKKQCLYIHIFYVVSV